MSAAASRPLRAAVFASGGGSNFQALLDHEAGLDDSPWTTVLLVTDRACSAQERARARGVAVRVVPVSGRAPAEVADETVSALRDASVDVIFLAGYLRLVPAPVVESWSGRVLNIHPALLPSFGGKGMWGRHVHEAVLQSGTRITGPTVHFVSAAYDEGSILAQWPVPVLDGDTAATLAARVLEAEHRLYPRAAEHLCRAVLAGRPALPLDPPSPHFMSAPEPLSSLQPHNSSP